MMQLSIWKISLFYLFLWQELSQVKAAALTERGHAEEELIKVRNQARLEEVRMALWALTLGRSEFRCLACFCCREMMSNSPLWASLSNK